MFPMSPTKEEEDLLQAQATLLEAVTLTAATKLQLETVRHNPDSSDERIMGASRDYRSAESKMKTAIDEAIQCHIAYAKARMNESKKKEAPVEEPGSFS